MYFTKKVYIFFNYMTNLFLNIKQLMINGYKSNLKIIQEKTLNYIDKGRKSA